MKLLALLRGWLKSRVAAPGPGRPRDKPARTEGVTKENSAKSAQAEQPRTHTVVALKGWVHRVLGPPGSLKLWAAILVAGAAVVALVWHLKTAPPHRLHVPGRLSARELHLTYCASCHEDKGRPLRPVRLDLAAFAETVRQGRGAMPAFEGVLDDEEYEKIYRHLKGAE